MASQKLAILSPSDSLLCCIKPLTKQTDCWSIWKTLIKHFQITKWYIQWKSSWNILTISAVNVNATIRVLAFHPQGSLISLFKWPNGVIMVKRSIYILYVNEVWGHVGHVLNITMNQRVIYPQLVSNSPDIKTGSFCSIVFKRHVF